MSSIDQEVEALKLKSTCPDCSFQFYVQNEVDEEQENASELISEWTSLKGKQYRLTWYDCPSCGKRVFVQCDDWRTEKILRKCIDVVARRKDVKSHRFDNAKKQSEYLVKLRKDLANSRKRVEEEVAGMQIIDSHSGTVHELEFYHGQD